MTAVRIHLVAAALAVAVPVGIAAGAAPDDPLDEEATLVTPREAASSLAQVVPDAVAPAAAEEIAGVRSDPGLRRSGGVFVVTGVPGRSAIDRDPTGGFAIATTAGRLEVVPDDVDIDASAPLLVAAGDAVMVANTGPAADTLTRPADGGIETFTQIRGPEAPEEYAWTVDLPEQEGLRVATDGGAEILGPNKAVIAAVTAPWARDAAGNDVRTWFTVSGDTLTLHVAHRGAQVVYPVAADPKWVPGWLRTTARGGARAVVWIGRSTGSAAGAIGGKVASVASAIGGNASDCAVGAWTMVRTTRLKSPWAVATEAAMGCVAGVNR